MRILWLANTPGLYGVHNGTGGYNGSGWIASLQQVLMSAKDIELGYVFTTKDILQKEKRDNVTYYPVFSPVLKGFDKLKYYWGQYKKIDRNKYVDDLLQIINEFRPDVIHLFGMESQFATILGKTKLPIVVHLQGILSPNDNAFWPVGINSLSLLFPITIREYILNNGFRFAKKLISERAKFEREQFKFVKHAMGRTSWDYQICDLLSGGAKYYKVNEVLRPSFYSKSDDWTLPNNDKFIIVSTVSDTMYKGLDLILKAANILKQYSDFDFEWHVIGINSKNNIIRFFEKQFLLNSKEIGIVYEGVKTEDQIAQMLSFASVYVHPSYIDNSPNSVCEAQMIGVPVICTNVGGVSTLVEHKKNGLLVPANAPFELVYWLKELHENKKLSSEIGKNGAEIAKNRHSKQQILLDLLGVYKSIVDREQ